MSQKYKKEIIFLLIVTLTFILSHNQGLFAKNEQINQGSNPPTFVPLNIVSLNNNSVDIQVNEPVETLMNSGQNIYVLVAFGSIDLNVYNALVIIANISNSLVIEYAFATNIMLQPLAFTPGSADMIQMNGNDLVLTFIEYSVYDSSPSLVSSLIVYNNESLFQFESDLYTNLNYVYQPYLSINAYSSISTTTASTATSSIKKKSLPGFDFTDILVLFSIVLFIRLKRR